MKGWVRDEAGVRVALTQRGVLIGRSSDCSIIVDDPKVSRRHALVLASEAGAAILPLGRQGIVCRGAVAHEPVAAANGDELEVGRARFWIELEAERRMARWLLGVGERRYPMSKRIFTVGGDAADDLFVAGWPAGAGVLHAVDEELFLELIDPAALDLVGSGPEESESVFRLREGALFSRSGLEVVVLRSPEAAATTHDEPRLPTAVALEFVPHGALLRVHIGADHAVYMPQKRADLVAALLSPPSGFIGGDWLDDEILIGRVWGHEGATRTQLNVLLHRTRRSLTEAGLNGPVLLERAPGGGAIRFRLARGARVSVL